MHIRVVLLTLALTLLPSIARADPCEGPLPGRTGEAFVGQVRYVGDGDSLCVGQFDDPGTWIEVRLADFDAPELHTSGGAAAKEAHRRDALGMRRKSTRRSFHFTAANQIRPRSLYVSALNVAQRGVNGRLRDECLNEIAFDSLAHARRELAKWRYDYNHVRPHSALGGASPASARTGAAAGWPGSPDGRSSRPLSSRSGSG